MRLSVYSCPSRARYNRRTVWALMVIPRSFSRSIESRTWSTAFLASMVPVRDRSRSARVDLPWSMWATMEKLRIRSMAIRLRIPRPCAGRRVPGPLQNPRHTRPAGLRTGIGGDDGVGFQDRGEAELGVGADADARPHDAVAEHRARAYHDVVPEDGALDPGAGTDDAAGAEHRVRAHPRARLDARAGADDARARDRRVRGDVGARRDGAAVRGRPGGRERGGDPPRQQIELALPVLARAADVEPVVAGDPAEERHAVPEQPGERLALDGHRAAGGNRGDHLAVERVDARVDGIHRRLAGRRLLDEAPDAPVRLELHEPVLAGIGDAGEVERRARAALGVEAQHRGEIEIGQDVAVQDDHEPAYEVHRVADAARGAERVRLHRVAEPHPVGRAVSHDPPDLVHHVGAGQDHVGDAVLAQEGELVGDERDVEERNDRLGRRQRQGPKPGPLTAREDDRGYFVGTQGSASLISITGMPSRTG